MAKEHLYTIHSYADDVLKTYKDKDPNACYKIPMKNIQQLVIGKLPPC